MAVRLRTLLEWMRTRLTALSADDYQQGGLAEVWHAIPSPYLIEDTHDSLAHLGFALEVPTVPAVGEREQSGDVVQYTAQVDVVFSYRVRHDNQVADIDLATDACGDLLRALADESSWGRGEVNVRILQRFQPQINGDEGWGIFRVSVAVTYEEGL